MNQLFNSYIKTFNLLSIGQRGVGKTVFLAGSYNELHPARTTKHQHQLWFDCQDSTEREKFEKINSYVAQNRQYPPSTLKITTFNFSLKRHHLWAEKTLCHFRWWDIPGEYCTIHNSDFQKLVLSSHACCVFINADALLSTPAYRKTLEEMMKQVVTIASVVEQHGLNYPLALIFTKCDLLNAAAYDLLEIEQKVQPLLTRLTAVKAHYKRFYSAIPIVSHAGRTALEAKGAAASILWLGAELRKLHHQQPQFDLGTELTQRFTNTLEEETAVEELFNLNSLTATSNNIFISLVVLVIGFFGIGVFVWFTLRPLTPTTNQVEIQQQRLISEYEQRLQLQPNDSLTMINLATLYIKHGQSERAIPLIQKLGRGCKAEYFGNKSQQKSVVDTPLP